MGEGDAVHSVDPTAHPQDPTGAPEALQTGCSPPNLVAHSPLAWHARQTWPTEQTGAVDDVQFESPKQFTQVPVPTSQKPAALPNLVQSLLFRQPAWHTFPTAGHIGADGDVQFDEVKQLTQTPLEMLQTPCALPNLLKHSESDAQPRHCELVVLQIGYCVKLLPMPQFASVVQV